MLINFCDNNLETKVKCDQPNTEGHDVKNLLTNNSGFLAYSTIKPPINIDFNFICNIKLSHIIIWPRVGSQKSIGFKVSVKLNQKQFYKTVSTGFLNENHIGIIFKTKYTNNNRISVLKNFLNVSISNYHNEVMNSLDNLRVTILKTDKSVPAISKIEIWGCASSNNKLESFNKILNLSSTNANKYENPKSTTTIKPNNKDIIPEQSTKDFGSLAIPEDYLDPITCSIMLQPIILPSGKIIDQTTLENYGESEALWGRQLSDPFTGILLNNNSKPIYDIKLKLKIDKFLSENADNLEIKQLPRTLGHKNNLPPSSMHHHQTAVNININNNDNKQVEMKNKLSITKCNNLKGNMIHKLPTLSRKYSRKIQSNDRNKTITNKKLLELNNDDVVNINCQIDDKLKNNLNNILLNLKCFSNVKNHENNINKESNSCKCCDHSIYYKLPCNHVVCRKKILFNINNKNLQCPNCNNNYKSSEIIRIL